MIVGLFSTHQQARGQESPVLLKGNDIITEPPNLPQLETGFQGPNAVFFTAVMYISCVCVCVCVCVFCPIYFGDSPTDQGETCTSLFAV